MDRIPAHAALSESVELCRAVGLPHAAGMVNAILRKLAAERASQGPAASPAASSNPPPPSPNASPTRAGWSSAGSPPTAARPPSPSASTTSANPTRRSLPPEPAAAPTASNRRSSHPAAPQMDDGSRLVAELAAAALPLTAGAPRVWDCCAAPGGKTLMLALRLPAAEILATDVSAKRLAHTAARLRRHAYAEHVRTAVADATAPPPSKAPSTSSSATSPAAAPAPWHAIPRSATPAPRGPRPPVRAPARHPRRSAPAPRARRPPRLLHLLARARRE
jgi:16S rRNA (cytosine967-C5)-methyltransferase